ncbi:VOC family protein [Rhodococcus sp. NPDC003318]|uniref:VOC family protein n=1 Tax=Rhodococcus sp. NPDC003318 TaxID=3364503 RepID=UPI00369E9E3C
MSNPVVHFEIHASEPQRLIDFYSELLGWSFRQFGEMPYWLIVTGGEEASPGAPEVGINGGLTQRRGPRPEPGAPVSGSTVVVAVEDVDGTFARGLELGGTEAIAPNDMPGVGRLAYLVDPDGNVFGFLSPVLSDGTNAMG